MPTPIETAGQVMEVVPLVMRTMRAEMRARRGPDLSVPQFRALGYVRRHPGSSLSALADHIGLTLPSASKLIDVLVDRRLVIRRIHLGDRRRMTLDLTMRGSTLLESAYNAAQVSLANHLAGLSEQERSDVVRAMELLNPIFARSTPKVTAKQGAIRHEQNGHSVVSR